ncbi:MAG: Lsr2 family protein [Bifidobacteriaceae bacterium]|jgi:hypothetical protein|nr:Lsr2 family protein [Bifidobacteriaceae bacterium]
MAQRTVVQLIDDLDQTPASQSVDFEYEGRRYSIDLNDQHAGELRDFLETYIKAGRKAGNSRRSGTSRRQEGFDPAAVRAWADSNGIEVSKRGRVPNWVVDRYREAGY